MNIGITLMLSDQTIPVNEAAPAVEERGFESFWVGEHTHCPVGTVHSRLARGRERLQEGLARRRPEGP